MSKRLSNYLTLDEVSELLGVETFDKWDDFYIENCDNYCQCSEELQNQGKCECGYEQGREDLFNRYTNAVDVLAESLLKEHGLKLVDTKKNWRKKLVPIVSWKDAANHIRMTINGYGMFEFKSVKEFMDSGPYTAYTVVLEHLHWMKKWYLVYGGFTARYQLERRMRY